MTKQSLHFLFLLALISQPLVAKSECPDPDIDPSQSAKYAPYLVNSQGCGVASHSGELTKKDKFQIEQWLRNAKSLWEASDYTGSQYFYQLVADIYPETYYAAEARKYLKKMKNPKTVKRREYIRKNPGLFPN